MGVTRQITVNSVTPTLISTTIDCTDVFVGEDPIVAGTNFPTTALNIIKGAVSNAGHGVPAGFMYRFADHAVGPRAAGQNFQHVGKYPAGTPVGWVQTVTGSITLFIDEEGAT